MAISTLVRGRPKQHLQVGGLCTRVPVAVDLFAGAGGLSLGFARAGILVGASVEMDRHAVATQLANRTSSNQPGYGVIHADIRAVSGDRVRAYLRPYGVQRPDILMGGPPCQGFSRSNMRTRCRENPLNHLYEEFLAIVAELLPLVVVMENVADLLTFDRGRIETAIVTGLRALGYRVEREVLDAVRYGVPQRRKRLVFLASRIGRQLAFPEPGANSQGGCAWGAISDLPCLPNGNQLEEMDYGSPTPLTRYQARMRDGSVRAHNNLVSRNSDLVVARYGHIPQGGNWRDIPPELMGNYTNTENCHEWVYRRLREEEPAITITNYRKNMLIHPRENRGLSVREAARLQSFPDSYIFCGSIGFQQQQVADAVPPLLAAAIALSVRNHLGS